MLAARAVVSFCLDAEALGPEYHRSLFLQE
jgi:hypothetical protein